MILYQCEQNDIFSKKCCLYICDINLLFQKYIDKKMTNLESRKFDYEIKTAIKMKYRIYLLGICLFLSVSLQANDFIWYDGLHPISYSTPEKVEPVVQTAIEIFCNDMLLVTGKTPILSLPYKEKNSIIRIAQLDESNSNELKQLGLPIDSLAIKKEAFIIKTIKNQIFVVGSDARGTAYGILELSRLAGVSPWIWWGDVAPEKKATLTLPTNFYTFQYPSVEFRGLFLNDEESLNSWSSRTFEPDAKTLYPIEKRFKGQFGPKTYAKMFELLLRLRANTIWPAMHEATMPFYFVEGNREIAEKYGIIVGTSHCEPLMRNSATEWNLTGKGAYNYLTNKDEILKYWSARLKELGNSENIFTIGMRGKHDGEMEGVHTTEEYKKALTQVIPDQIKLLEQYINPDVEKIPQQFVPYKEVLDVFDENLQVPDYIMLTWCDDNYGYLTRLSDTEQQKRSGGAGVYYHLSYWGRPHSYVWLTTTQPGLIYYEMKNAWKQNARRLWMVNVHDPKKAAYDLELFLDMAWNVELPVSSHLSDWLKREFGAVAGEKLLPVMREFYRLTAIRKPEFMGWNQIEVDDRKKYPKGRTPVTDTEFSFTEFGNEADRYISDYEKIKSTVLEVEKIIPSNRKDAYFAIVKYPVFGAAAVTTKCLEAQRARGNGSKTAKNKSMAAYNETSNLTDYYNNKMAGGKWKYSMSNQSQYMYVFGEPNFESDIKDRQKQKESEAEYIAKNACDFTHSSTQTEVVDMLGHSMNAVPLPKGETLTYEFETNQEGEAVLRTAVIPTQPNDKGDIRFSVQIDNEQPQTISFREEGRTETWKQNVLRGQAVKTTNHTIEKGKHTLKIAALDDHIVIDQWMLDFDKDRKFYVFPVKLND